MALDAGVHPQDPFGYYGYRDCYGGVAWGYDHFPFQENDKSFLGILENENIAQQQVQQNTVVGLQQNWDSSSSSIINQHANQEWEQYPNSSPESCPLGSFNPTIMGQGQPLAPPPPPPPPPSSTIMGRRKRRRTKSTKNKEEMENQRMTHIAVERNRRKQMNEYLAVLRSLMPPSYVQRGDQASIVGGAINFVKELEQLLQTMEAQKKTKLHQPNDTTPLADFFTFPQYSTRTPAAATTGEVDPLTAATNQNQWATADIEVTMVESHANLKILSKKRPRQLLKIVAGLQSLRFSVLHLNVTTVDQMVLYSVSVKVEEGCLLNTVDDIAAAINEMLHRINEEEAAAFS